MKITKNFLFFICITTIFRTIAMEEFTPPETKKALKISLNALSLEMPKYQHNNARQNFNTLMGIFCSTKGDTKYNFLQVLRIEQEDLVKEIYKLKTDKEIFNLEYLSKNQNLQREQESLKEKENNINQKIIEAKKEFEKLETLKQEQITIENLKAAHQNQLNALKDEYKANLNADRLASEERYKQECAAFQKKIIDDNQKSLTSITNRQKAEFEMEREGFKNQLNTKYQNEKAALETEYTTRINTLVIQNSDLEKDLEKQYIEADSPSPHLSHKHLLAATLGGLFFGGLTTFLSMHYNIANSSLESITSLAGKLFNKTH